MAFDEKTKLQAKRRSHFCCCICKQPFVEVHHITPQADGGPDTLDNAAPLCARCHDLFGGNPEKRKQIRQMRDFWWELCAKDPDAPIAELNRQLDDLYSKFDAARAGTGPSTVVFAIREALAEFYDQNAKRVQTATTAREVSEATGVVLPPALWHPPSEIKCPRCGQLSHLVTISPSAPFENVFYRCPVHGAFGAGRVDDFD